MHVCKYRFIKATLQLQAVASYPSQSLRASRKLSMDFSMLIMLHVVTCFSNIYDVI